MSLTRDEWSEMWEAIKTIEYTIIKRLKIFEVNDRPMYDGIVKIKQLIQSVNGRME